MDSLSCQAAAYFKQEAGFNRLLPLLIKKYQSLGRLGGSVTLAGLTETEARAFFAFFRRSFNTGDAAVITFSEFAAALAKTKFDGVDILDVFACYLGREVVTRQEEIRQKEQKLAGLWRNLSEQYAQPLCQRWLAAVSGGQPGSRSVYTAYNRNPAALAESLDIVLKALASLPQDYVRLPVFARHVCGDPHALDSTAPAGRMLLDALRMLAGSEEGVERSAVEEENELLYSFGLLRDDIQNFITCCGIIASQEQAYWLAAWQAGAVLNVPLRQIVRSEMLSCADKGLNHVFVVENAGVFSAIIDWFENEQRPLPPLVCTHGQFKLASWAALERLVRGGCHLWYSGDFDPEGLLMAQRLMVRFPNNACLWRYTTEDYIASLPAVTLDELRLNKLQSVNIAKLQPVADKMRQLRKAGYQEAFIGGLIEDIIKRGKVFAC